MAAHAVLRLLPPCSCGFHCSLLFFLALVPSVLVQYRDTNRGPDLVRKEDARPNWGKYEETPRDEVERLLRDYKQNQELLRRLGNRYYQVVYPIQVRHREKMGISTREIDSRNPPGGVDGRGVNELEPTRLGPRHQQKHYRQTSLLIKAFQHKFRLDLELNSRLLAPNVQKKVFLAGGATATSTSASQDVEQCYYHGVVKDWQGGEFIPGSMAALQTCNGVSGIIHLGNETFVIHPFYGGDLSSKHPHIIYESNEKPKQLCGVLDNQLRNSNYHRQKRHAGDHDHEHEHHDHVHHAGDHHHDHSLWNEEEEEYSWEKKVKNNNLLDLDYRKSRVSDHIPEPSLINSKTRTRLNVTRSRRDVRYVPKFIETALVLDKAMFDNRPGLSRRDVIHESIQVANIADLYFKTSLKTRLSIVYVETWEDLDQAPGISKQIEINKAMEDFGAYVQRKLYEIEKDTTQMFTGRNSYKNGETTTASVGRICTERSVGVNVDVNPFEPHILASNLAHAIGHNLGFGHDDMQGSQGSSGGPDSCSCNDWHGCIMKSSVSGEEGIQPYKFSECSFKQFQRWMEQGSALCLLNRPSELGPFGTCGNGVIDDNEDCDCGSEATCESNPCCSPITCKLKIDAECSSGPCCDNCRMKPKDTLCRHAVGECDLNEFCTGDSGECPANLYVKNGLSCLDMQGSDGFCFNGDCPTKGKQCQDLWGHGAESGENECFDHYNVKGTAQGNCGENKYKYSEDSEFKKCQRSDVLCGTLHCQGGLEKPIVTGGVTHINMQGRLQNKHVECKIMTGGMDENTGMSDLGLVRDGAKCGESKICMNQTCKDISHMMTYTKCPQNTPPRGGRLEECSANGKCSNINTCVCDPGWSGIDCSVPVKWQITTPTMPSPQTKSPQGATHPDEGPTKSHTHVLKESDSDTIIMVIMLVVGVGCIFILFAIMALCYRRKSALPKYDPPYLKRPMVPPKGYSHPNSPHPSQHMTPDHAYPDDGNKMISYTPTPTYRSVDHFREHGMKRIGNHGSIGSQHQIQPNMGSNQILGSGQNLMSESYQQEKGILKKPGPPYCPLDKDRWDDRLSSSSQNNLVNLTGGMVDSGSRQQMPERPDSRRTEISDVERTLKSLNGYHEDILEALRDAASTRSGPTVQSGGHPYSALESTPVLTEELKRHLVESRAATEYRSQHELRQQPRDKMETQQHPVDQDEMGPIRIRNLEDLIRQLEHSSNRHMSPSGSEDVRMSSETEADRHFRSPAGHCSSADRYFQSLHGHGCEGPGLGDGHSHREHIEDGSESDSIESIYKKLSTPKRPDSRTGSRGSSIRGGRPLPSPHEFQ
eukprot:TRINITY_DN12230_c0_g1_i1.p1 TRINITY_DN12230_c0_g1~~TRINITY_DN12230_c0_g1_i1.p1  ORF type:complete len:1327 (+),score=242.49 TRINITY_DN12230_c0_g1_i1:487-4467(+)